MIIFNEKTLVQAYKDLKVKQFLSENITINLACLFGWVYGAYIEAIVVSLIYQVGERLLMRLINLTMEKIDDEGLTQFNWDVEKLVKMNMRWFL